MIKKFNTAGTKSARITLSNASFLGTQSSLNQSFAFFKPFADDGSSPPSPVVNSIAADPTFVPRRAFPPTITARVIAVFIEIIPVVVPSFKNTSRALTLCLCHVIPFTFTVDARRDAVDDAHRVDKTGETPLGDTGRVIMFAIERSGVGV